jgi:hypothetical protein
MQIETGFFYGPAYDAREVRDVGAACEFWYDATKVSMFVDGRFNNRCVYVEFLVDDGSGRLVTTRFESQHQFHSSSVLALPPESTKRPDHKGRGARATTYLIVMVFLTVTPS